MLIQPPVTVRRRQKKEPVQVVVAPSALVKVLGVKAIDSTGAVWIFSVPVVVSDGEPCAQLRIQTDSGWQGIEVLGVQSSAYLAAGDIANSDLTPGGGQPWEVTEQPEGLDFGGKVLELPQSGITS